MMIEITHSSQATPVSPVQDVAGNCLRIILQEHAALSAMLRSILMILERGPGDEPERFFDLLRVMLFYIDEFPERLHHPKESDLLFPKVARLDPRLMPTIDKLERDHMRGETLVCSLQRYLLAWEMMGESRRKYFTDAAHEYAAFYLEHMRLEEAIILPAAEKLLTAADWSQLYAAFETNRDPFAGLGQYDSAYDRIFTKIVTNAPAPIGVGPG